MPGTGLTRDAPAVARIVFTTVLTRLIWLLRLVYSPNVHMPRESGPALARLAVDDDVAGISGEYYEGLRPIKSNADSYDEAKQEGLWRWTAEFLAQDEEELRRFEELR
ncbi:hypothetical protein DL771_004245 [Monosporascus sp. 5C6A]|nr:hypothetical protein DL771_004245 [Monosporascus sp. 5C6A]